MENFISFLPILVYSLAGTILYFTKKITFNNQMVLLGLALTAHIVLSILGGYWVFTLGQVLIGSVVFFLLILMMGGKTSGETILTMSAIIALTPLPIGFISVGVVFIVTFILGILAIRKQQDSVKNVMLDAVFSTGMGQSMPNYEHLQDRKALDPEQKKFSLLPIVSLVMFLSALFYLVQPMFLEA
ncbi:MAG: hypothetical protein H9W81_21935 [Enterococcus sp.]|nr:hypothetical protein [Enterococcus sp.]